MSSASDPKDQITLDAIIEPEVLEYENKKREEEEFLASLTPEQREAELERRERQGEEDYMASLAPEQKEAALRRMKEIHFGTLGIPMRKTIRFSKAGAQYIVGSGTGKPNNGGTLVVVPGEGLWLLKALTRRLMGNEFDEEGDVWSLWDHEGESLRSIFEQKGFGTPSRSS